MSVLRLYRLKAPCPACGRNPTRKVAEEARRDHLARPRNKILEYYECGQFRGGRICRERYWIRAAAWHDAVLVEEIHTPDGSRPDIAPAMVQLEGRQAEVCALVVQGISRKRIALALQVSESTVQEYLERAVRNLRDADPSLAALSVRKAVQKYFADRAGAGIFEVQIAA